MVKIALQGGSNLPGIKPKNPGEIAPTFLKNVWESPTAHSNETPWDSFSPLATSLARKILTEQMVMRKKKCNTDTTNRLTLYHIVYINIVYMLYVVYMLYNASRMIPNPGALEHFYPDTYWVDIHLLPAWSKSLGSFCKDLQDWPEDLEIPLWIKIIMRSTQLWGASLTRMEPFTCVNRIQVFSISIWCRIKLHSFHNASPNHSNF